MLSRYILSVWSVEFSGVSGLSFGCWLVGVEHPHEKDHSQQSLVSRAMNRIRLTFFCIMLELT